MTGPSKPLGMSDFFALEAGEYLERLDGLLAKSEGPSADELVRLARALRGSALMANQPAIARAAAGLEALGRAPAGARCPRSPAGRCGCAGASGPPRRAAPRRGWPLGWRRRSAGARGWRGHRG